MKNVMSSMGQSRNQSRPLSVSDVTAFAERVRAALIGAEADRRTIEALTLFISGQAGEARRSGVARVSDEELLELVRAQKNGARAGDLLKATRMHTKALTRAMRRLREEGSIVMVGEKRTARYHISPGPISRWYSEETWNHKES